MNDAERMRELLLDLERSRQHEAASRRAAEAMVGCLRALTLARDPEEMLGSLLAELLQALDADGACMLTPDPGAPGCLRSGAARGLAPDGGAWMVSGILSRIGPRRPITAIFDVALLPEWDGHRAGGAIVAALHISVGSESSPAQVVCTSRERGHFEERHLALARALAPIAAQALVRADERQRLEAEIRERRRIEAELLRTQNDVVHLRRMEAVSQLAGGLAHEINTPLQYVSDNLRFISTSFSGINNLVPTLSDWLRPHMDQDVISQFLEAADYGFLAVELPKAIEQCQAGLERVGSIVDGLKRFALADDGPPAPGDINDAIRTTVEVCRGGLADGIAIHLDLRDIPPVVCRIGEIRQVVHNLLLNASAAIIGRGRIDIGTRLADGMIEITITDDGRGMEPEILERIRAATRDGRLSGPGIGHGLAIAQQVAIRLGGGLQAESQPGSGTRLVLSLRPA